MDVADGILAQRSAALSTEIGTTLLRRSLDTQKAEAAQFLQLLEPAGSPPPSIDRGRGASVDLYA